MFKKPGCTKYNRAFLFAGCAMHVKPATINSITFAALKQQPWHWKKL